MSQAAIEVSPVVAGQALLEAQALTDDPQRRASPAVVQKLIERLGFVQIDSINVVERAHHLTLFSRLHGYRPAMLTELLEKRRSLFEHWTHDASAIPTEWFPHWRPRFTRYLKRVERQAWWAARLGSDRDALIAAIREHVARHGPVQSRDFERSADDTPAEKGWWGWSREKAALEHLWRSGELAIVKRVNFQKHYDLIERVLPNHHALPEPTRDEHIDWACRQALSRLGVASPTELASFFRSIEVAEARSFCDKGVRSGELVPVIIKGGDRIKPLRAVAFASSARALQRAERQQVQAARGGGKGLADDEAPIRALSPFDPIVRERARALRLFGFDYRFEAFVPRSARKYGYYVMPLLQDGRLIGRINPKFHRDQGVLAVDGTYWERGIKPTPPRRRALEQALRDLAVFVGAEKVQVSRTAGRGR